MEFAPLIHSRTLHCDFNPNFAVRADDIDVNWAMKKILLAMSDVDILNGVRRVVASNDRICIAGIACNLRFFAENYLNDSNAEKYFHDERGREVKIFLGYSFKGGNRNEIPDVSYSMLWNMFKENLAPVWESTTAETVRVSYKNCPTKNFSGGMNFMNIGGVNFAESNESNDEKIFAQCLAEKKNLCTNADQNKIISSGEFEIISTSQSLINRAKSESEKKNSPTPPQPQLQATTPTSQRPRRVTPQEKSNNLPAVLAVAAIILIILVVVFFVM